jgi:hypothetical protein
MVGKVVTMFSLPMTFEVEFRAAPCFTIRNWTLFYVLTPVFIESVQTDEGLAAVAGASVGTRRLRAYSKDVCHFHISCSNRPTRKSEARSISYACSIRC